MKEYVHTKWFLDSVRVFQFDGLWRGVILIKLMFRIKVKGNIQPGTGHANPEGVYNSTVSLASSLDEWVGNSTPRLLYPRERELVPTFTSSWVSPKVCLERWGKSRLHRPARNGVLPKSRQQILLCFCMTAVIHCWRWPVKFASVSHRMYIDARCIRFFCCPATKKWLTHLMVKLNLICCFPTG